MEPGLEFETGGNDYLILLSKNTYATSKRKCREAGGEMAVVNDRKTWRKLALMVTGGWDSFWISSKSSDVEARMFLVDKAKLTKRSGGIVANVMEDVRHVPPQWNVVDR